MLLSVSVASLLNFSLPNPIQASGLTETQDTPVLLHCDVQTSAIIYRSIQSSIDHVQVAAAIPKCIKSQMPERLQPIERNKTERKTVLSLADSAHGKHVSGNS